MAANDKGRTQYDIVIPSLTNAQINTEIIKAKVATKIIASRNELGMNQSVFAHYMGVSQTMVSKWENGDCNFSLSTICEICDKLSLNIDFQICKQENYRNAEANQWSGVPLDILGAINPAEEEYEDMVA